MKIKLPPVFSIDERQSGVNTIQQLAEPAETLEVFTEPYHEARTLGFVVNSSAGEGTPILVITRGGEVAGSFTAEP